MRFQTKIFKTLIFWSIHIVLGMLMIISFAPLPKPFFKVPYVTTLLAADGTLLSASIAEDQQWRFPPSDTIPKKLSISMRLLEDEYFYQHPGVNPVSLIRAVAQNIREGEIVSGGSTITMQTVRMAFGNQPRTYSQKLIELIAAFKLELSSSKQDILKAYADYAPFGGNIVGIKAAARRYFGRSPHQLSWSEAATLAVLPNNPAAIFPGKGQTRLLYKRDRLLEKIHDRGFIDENELFLAKQETPPGAWKDLPNQAYHLLHRGIKEGLKGSEIHSTLDSRLQMLVKEKVDQFSNHMSKNQIHNAAAIVASLNDGNTLAYVGNTNNPGIHGQHVDVINSRRSPGSLLKPILYAAALDVGLITPQKLLPDTPIFYRGFAPKNFDKNYRGAVPADQALVSSLNVPFVHLLIDFGYEKFHQKLVELGFESFDQPAGYYGLSMILGGAETTLWELSGVYSSLGRSLMNFPDRPFRAGYADSDFRPLNYLQRLEVKIEKLKEDGPIRAPSIHFAFDAMKKLNRPYQESGWERFASSREISWKTGTSYGYRDGWAIGIAGNYLVGIWLGNADGEGRPGLTGINAAAPLMFELFDLLEYDNNADQFFGTTTRVCAESGMLATINCLKTNNIDLPEYLLDTKTCSYHMVIHLDQTGEHQVLSSCYEVDRIMKKSWFVLPPAQAWYYQKYHPDFKNPPTYLPGCMPNNNEPLLELIYPGQFTKVHIPKEQDGIKGQVVFEAAHEHRSATIYWHLDQEYLGYTNGRHQKGIRAAEGAHLITLVDDLGNELQQRFEVIN